MNPKRNRSIRTGSEPTDAAIVVKVDAQDKKIDLQALIDRAMAISTVSNSLRRGLSIKLERSR
jgi:hypothetical protein